MANVRVEQRNAHLAGPVRGETIAGRHGDIGKAVLTAISNRKRGRGESRENEPTAIQWTLWGKQAENAAQYLGKGSHVNVVGRLRNNHYKDDAGNMVSAPRSRARRSTTSTARRRRMRDARRKAARQLPSQPTPAAESKLNARSSRQVKPRKASNDDDIPF